MFSYKCAITRKLSKYFNQAQVLHKPTSPINLSLARKQHQQYVEVLKQLLDTVIELDALDDYPDCCFVEDCCEVISPYVIINQLGAPSRRGEELAIAAYFEESDLCLLRMNGDALADGGDMLYTGRHLIVGLSRRTNEQALAQISAMLPSFDILALFVEQGLHLKSFMTQITEKLLVVSDCQQGRFLAETLNEMTGGYYQFVHVPDMVASNVLRINNTVIIQAGFGQSSELINKICTDYKLNVIELEMSEFIKADGALTCCSILI